MGRADSLPGVDENAVAAAVRYELTHCSWDWSVPFAVHLAAETALATPTYGLELRARADQVSWRAIVVRQHQVVTCRALDARLEPDAPNTDTTAYVRLVLAMHVDSRLGSFDTGELTASCLMRRIGERWLVAGPFQGG